MLPKKVPHTYSNISTLYKQLIKIFSSSSFDYFFAHKFIPCEFHLRVDIFFAKNVEAFCVPKLKLIKNPKQQIFNHHPLFGHQFFHPKFSDSRSPTFQGHPSNPSPILFTSTSDPLLLSKASRNLLNLNTHT